MNWYAILLFISHLVVGIGALFGGFLGMSDPTLASMGADAGEMLKHSPFHDFFIPGLFLFVVIGLGNIAAGIAALSRWLYKSYFSGLAGCILMAWIVIQCVMLRDVNALHIIFFVIGALQALFALLLILQQDLFPASQYKKLLSVLRGHRS